MKKLGIVGFGKIAKHHKLAFESIGCQLVAAANRSESGRELARNQGIPATYSSACDMMLNESLDAVIACPAENANYAVASDVIRAGIPLLLEKPPGTSVLELEKLIALQRTSGSPVMVGLNRIWYSSLVQALDDLASPADVSMVDLVWSEQPTYLRDVKNFPHSRIQNWTFANSIHGLSMVQRVAGQLRDVVVNIVPRPGYMACHIQVSAVSLLGASIRIFSSWELPLQWQLRFATSQTVYNFAPIEDCVKTDLNTKQTQAFDRSDDDREFKPGFRRQAIEFKKLLEGTTENSEASLESCADLFHLAEKITNKIKSLGVSE